MNDPRPANHPQQVFLNEEPWLYGMAKRLVRDDASARDVVQDVYMAMVTNPPRDLSTPRAWLATVARRIVQGGRDRRAVPLEAAMHEVDPTSRPEEKVAQFELVDLILAAASGLDEDLQRTVWLRFKEGRKQADIARELGVDERTVRARLERAYEKMRVQLAPHVHTEFHGSWWAWLPALLPWAWPNRAKEPGEGIAATTTWVLPLLTVVLPAALITILGVSHFTGSRDDGSALAHDDSTRDQSIAVPSTTPLDQQTENGLRIPLDGRANHQPELTTDAAPKEHSNMAGEPATYRVHGALQLHGLGEVELEAAMLREGWYSDQKTADTGTATIGPEGQFSVAVVQSGNWRLLVRPTQGTGNFAFFSMHDLGNSNAAASVDFEATLRPFEVVAPSHEDATLNVTWHDDASGWHFEASAQVNDGVATFAAVPTGQVHVFRAPKGRPEPGDHGEFLDDSPIYEVGENILRIPR